MSLTMAMSVDLDLVNEYRAEKAADAVSAAAVQATISAISLIATFTEGVILTSLGI